MSSGGADLNCCCAAESVGISGESLDGYLKVLQAVGLLFSSKSSSPARILLSLQFETVSSELNECFLALGFLSRDPLGRPILADCCWSLKRQRYVVRSPYAE